MNDQRSDDDRHTGRPDPHEGEERTPAPDGAAETEGGVEPETGSATASESGHQTTTPGEAEPEDAERGGDPSNGEAPVEGDADRDPAADDDGSGSGDSGEGTTTAVPPERRGGRWVLALALLIALVAAGAAGYLGWRLHKLEQRVADIPAEREKAIDPLAERSALRSLENELESRFEQRLQSAVDDKAEALISARDEALGAVRERLATVESGVADIRELATRDQINWRLAEIRYLLSIAQRRVSIDRDTRSAIAALEAADRAISGFGDVRLLPLRQRIIENLSALRSVDTADLEGIALRLQNLLARVPDLPAAGSVTTVEASESNATSGWWQTLVNRLDRFVTVRRREAGPEPGRPQPSTGLPEADTLVLALERARSAALSRDPAAYQRALERAEGALDDGFAADTRATEHFRDGLAWLRERPVEVEMPDLGPTVDLAERLSARIESSRDGSPAAGDEAED